jgi:hypothetical protein
LGKAKKIDFIGQKPNLVQKNFEFSKQKWTNGSYATF